LKWWRWRLSGDARRAAAAAKSEPTKAAFVEIGPATPVPEAPVAGGSFEVVLRNGRVVRVPSGFSDGELARVLAVAEGRAR